MSDLGQAIDSQPALLRRVLELEIRDVVKRLNRGGGRILVVGTGTSQHAAELGSQMLRLAGKDATAESAASFSRRPTPSPRDKIILITHTGETAFAKQVRHSALSTGATLVSITGQGVGWPEGIEIAPREESETYTASYAACLLFLARLAGALGASEFDDEALSAVPDAVRRALRVPLPPVSPESRVLAVVGWGAGATTAREGALKLREAARMIAEGYEGEYLLHGSAVPLRTGDSVLLLQPASDPDGLLPLLGAAAHDAGIEVIEISEDELLDPILQQIPLTVLLQRLAKELAVAGGHDPDQVILGGWADDRLWAAGNHS